ncbi:hypothetical protein [Teredinibacter turnerae]|uniref:hypothetical protein n=1 Tax=Teredinibacter turnerae TaxID=2426 RepID=UPI0030CCE65F
MEFLKKYGLAILSCWIAFVFVQSLFFKFSNSLETQYIFGTLGAWSGFTWFAAYGAYAIGSLELVAAVGLFTRWRPFAALLALGIISGAIVFHLFTPLGVVMPSFDSTGNVSGDDGGTLFVMACLVWASALVIVWRELLGPNGRLHIAFSSQQD